MLLVVLNSLGCQSGPKVEICIVDGKEHSKKLDCSDARTNSVYYLEAILADGYFCMSPSHSQSFFYACKQRRSVDVDVCILHGIDAIFLCGGVSPEREYALEWGEGKGYICTNPRDMRLLMNWCYR
ncbi:MAG: hypothetical protein QW818_02580 [Candidatus Aenigmatarchaeota archaeon]